MASPFVGGGGGEWQKNVFLSLDDYSESSNGFTFLGNAKDSTNSLFVR